MNRRALTMACSIATLCVGMNIAACGDVDGNRAHGASAAGSGGAKFDASTAEADGSIDDGSLGDAEKPCGACTGCCDTTTVPPTCRLGTSYSYCGINGEICKRCLDGSGACMVEWGTCALCGPLSCPNGCCGGSFQTDYPVCLPGTYDPSCGAGGLVCTDCAVTGQTCMPLGGDAGGQCAQMRSESAAQR
jgi:hypothetical protein